MKTNNIAYGIVTLIVISCLAMSCSEHIYDEAYKPSLESKYIDIWPNEFEFNSNGGTSDAFVYSLNEWLFRDVDSWVTISPSSGKGDANVTIGVAENESPYPRVALFRISNSNDVNVSRPVTVNQEGGTAFAWFPSELNGTVTISAPAQEILIPIETNVSTDEIYISTTMDSSQGEYELTNDGLLLKVTQNTGSVRSYTFSIRARGGTSSTIKILQEMPTMSADTDVINKEVDVMGGNFTFNLNSDVDWQAKISGSWMSISPESGSAGTNQLTLSISPNNSSASRTGYVTFTDGTFSRLSLKIVQQGEKISFSESKVYLLCKGSIGTNVTLTSNTSWKLAEKPSWLRVTPAKGESGKTVLTISAETNESIANRSGKVVVKSLDESVMASLECEQLGQDYGVNKDELLFNWNASTQTVDLSTGASWSCVVSDSWISVSQNSGTGNATLTVSVDKNSGPSDRKGHITIVSNGEPIITITVIQYGQFFYVESSSGNIGAMGGDIQLSVFSSVGANVRVAYTDENGGWLKYTKQDDASFILTAAYNNSINNRNAQFIIEPTEDDVNEEYKQGIIYSVTQSGRQLSSNVSTIEVAHSGGTSETYSITSDGNYDIYKDTNDAWFALLHSKETGTFSVFVTENNTGGARKGIITIALSGLPDGEKKEIKVTVLQIGNTSFDISIDGYGQDKNWNL